MAGIPKPSNLKASNLKFSIHRDFENGTRRPEKRRVSWQDRVGFEGLNLWLRKFSSHCFFFFLPPLITTFDMCCFSYVNEKDFYIVSIHRFEKELYSFLTVLDTDFRLLPSRVFRLTRVHYYLARFLRSFMLIEYYCLVNPCSSRPCQLGNYANLLRQNPWMVVKHIWVFSFSLLFLNDLPTLAFDLRMHWAQLSGKKIMFLSLEFKWLANSFAMHGNLGLAWTTIWCHFLLEKSSLLSSHSYQGWGVGLPSFCWWNQTLSSTIYFIVKILGVEHN